METNRPEGKDGNRGSGAGATRTYTGGPGSSFEKTFTRTEVLGAIESGLRKWFPGLVVLAISVFLPLTVAGRPATIGPDEQLYRQFDRGPDGPSSPWKVSLHVDNDDCVDPSLNCFYFQQQADSSWALYAAVGTDLSTQHPDNACHLGAPADPGTYRLFALNTTKACILRVTFRADR